MIAIPSTTTGRFVLAIALSVLLHIFLLTSPAIMLPAVKEQLPALTAKLEPRPKAKPATRPVKQHPTRLKEAPPRSTSGSRKIASSISQKTAPTAPPQAEAPTIAEPVPPLSTEAAQDVPHAHPLPKHAQLAFSAFQGTFFSVGEVRYQLDIDDDMNYTIIAGANTTGIVGLFKNFEMNQQSRGTLTEQGLRPDSYSEIRNNSKGAEKVAVDFNWAEHTMTFSNDEVAALPDQTQDILSFVFQLSQLPLDDVVLPMFISNGRKLGNYELLVGVEEEIETPLGKLRALPISKMGNPEDTGMTVWLGLEYRLLPVKVRQIDRNDEIIAEMLVTDIRLSDE